MVEYALLEQFLQYLPLFWPVLDYFSRLPVIIV